MNKKCTEKEFKRLIKKYKPKQVIYQHVMWKINLTSKQLDYLIKAQYN